MKERIIKFRAWNFNMYRMDYFNLGDTIPYYYKDDVAVQYDFMQFTGLKDKNGKEIYEGDIVRAGNGDKYNGGIGVVKYKTNNLQNFPINGYIAEINNDEWFSIFTEDISVIGNIWENPSLISPERTEKLK